MIVINSLYALIATLGFCVIFNIKGKYLITASIGGALGWFSYLIFKNLNLSNIAALFFSSVVLGVYSEVAARLLRAPVTTFVICALIPLVPGSGMYYTMLESIQGNIFKSLEIGLETVSSAGALAVGIVFVSSIARLINLIKIKNLR
jgi:uncharacterized membrane protein YjjB (DUF3815 family)